MKKLIIAFWEILTGAFVSVIDLRWSFLKCLLIPIICLSVIDTVAVYYMFSTTYFLYLFIYLYIYTIIAVTTHRLVLFGSDSVSAWSIFKWSKPEFIFAKHMVLLSLIFIPVGIFSFVLEITSKFGIVISSILAFFLLGRFAFVFPAAAIGSPITFDQSWESTKGYRMLMTIVAGVVPYCFLIPLAFAAKYLPNSHYSLNLLLALSLVFEISLISHAYKIIYPLNSIANKQRNADSGAIVPPPVR